jgi:hypothetical protein
MKNLIVLLGIALLILGMVFLYQIAVKNENETRANGIATYEALHNLQKFKIHKEHVSQSESGGGFFLFVGGYHTEGKEQDSLYVVMSFANGNGEYQTIKTPMTSIRVKEDNNNEIPAISFIVKDRYSYDYNIPLEKLAESQDERLQGQYYVLVHCKKGQFTQEINLNKGL